MDAYRAGFDVSLPLFHPSHPMRDGASGKAGSNTFPANDRYFVSFKGKRYVYGIGSETRWVSNDGVVLHMLTDSEGQISLLEVA